MRRMGNRNVTKKAAGADSTLLKIIKAAAHLGLAAAFLYVFISVAVKGSYLVTEPLALVLALEIILMVLLVVTDLADMVERLRRLGRSKRRKE